MNVNYPKLKCFSNKLMKLDFYVKYEKFRYLVYTFEQLTNIN